MNDKLKRRLAGAALLLVAAFIVVSLLPTPEETAHQAGVEVVTIPLHEVISTVPQPTASKTLPQTLAAPDDAPALSAGAHNSEEHDGDGTATQDLSSSGGDDDTGDSTSPASKPVNLAMSPALQKESLPTDSRPAPPPAPQAASKALKPKPKPAVVEAPKPVSAKPATPSPGATIAAKPAAEKQLEERPANPPAVTGQKWFVQVGGFADIDNARKVQATLQGMSQPTVLAPIDTAKGTIYRVRAGPYASEATAQQAFGKISAHGFSGSQLIRP